MTTGTTQEGQAPKRPTLEVTERAATRLKQLAGEGKRIRLEILAGGCSGFQRVFRFDTLQEGDLCFGPAGAELLIDPTSLNLISGSVVDFTDTLAGSEFELKNPNASSACGCGASFNL
ncbi:MAG: iron-sulfur cluster assembly accessory protein [Alphaproteobacteria bacterium]|nr:iron-sulfur cluster assembly accessory protein [Alphaproteobacteria bacterium]